MKKEQKIVKITEKELFSMLNEQMTHPEKYGKRKEMMSNLKGAEYSLTNSIGKLEDAYDDSKTLDDDELHLSSKLNKCYTKLRKELTEIRSILEEASQGDFQPTQGGDEVDSLQQEGRLE
jgi:uncharacterized coiled-coil DUF342 family protein